MRTSLRRCATLVAVAILLLTSIAIGAAATGVSVNARVPRPGDRVPVGYPTIVAVLDTHGGAAVDRETLRVFLDERDVTESVTYSDGLLTATPHQRLSAGSHVVIIRGADRNGNHFRYAWGFDAEDVDVVPTAGVGANVPFSASVQPLMVPGEPMRLDFTGPPGAWGYAAIGGVTGVFDFVSVRPGQFFTYVPISGTYGGFYPPAYPTVIVNFFTRDGRDFVFPVRPHHLRHRLSTNTMPVLRGTAPFRSPGFGLPMTSMPMRVLGPAPISLPIAPRSLDMRH